ncbi:MAG: hypothetical protein ABIO35_02740, partial [Nitrobacter sp.]
ADSRLYLAALRMKRTLDNAFAAAVNGFSVCSGNHLIFGRRRGHGGVDLAFFQGPAGILSASGL